MKRFIKAAIRKAGWELHRINQPRPPGKERRSTMRAGIEWLGRNNLSINTVLDVGASNGCWSEICMNSYPDADYVLFEPQPVHSHALDSFAASRKQNVHLLKKAVGSTVGHTFFDATTPFGGALAKEKIDNRIIEVDQITIDAAMSQGTWAEPYLIKLDTHGFEKSILEGAQNTLEKTDVLIIEAYNYRITEEALLFWELCQYLSDRGFRPIDLVDVSHRQYDDSLWQMDLFFIRSSWSGFGYVRYT